MNKFDRDEIMKGCEKIDDVGGQISYLRDVKHNYVTNRPEIDKNLFMRPNLEDFLDEQIEYREKMLKNMNEDGKNSFYRDEAKDNTERTDGGNIKLRRFERNELKEEMEKFVTEFSLEKGETVSSKIINLITRKLVNDGWNAKNTSISSKLRSMGYVKEKRI